MNRIVPLLLHFINCQLSPDNVTLLICLFLWRNHHKQRQFKCALRFTLINSSLTSGFLCLMYMWQSTKITHVKASKRKC